MRTTSRVVQREVVPLSLVKGEWVEGRGGSRVIVRGDKGVGVYKWSSAVKRVENTCGVLKAMVLRCSSWGMAGG